MSNAADSDRVSLTGDIKSPPLSLIDTKARAAFLLNLLAAIIIDAIFVVLWLLSILGVHLIGELVKEHDEPGGDFIGIIEWVALYITAVLLLSYLVLDAWRILRKLRRAATS